MNKMIKTIFITIGILSLVLASIGMLLPVLPTTPFLLVSSFCFAKGSDKFDKWFKSSKIYKNNLESFVENKSMKLRQKIFLLLFADIMIAFPLVILDNIYIKMLLILIVLFKYYYFIFKIKTIT
ncbi:MAG: YbaN family protein [Romboutsia sp.]|uniref:YbaN family protein n=1 Tax=Romboutsia sp. TaxID=1965302 RepID=UPI003F353AF2